MRALCQCGDDSNPRPKPNRTLLGQKKYAVAKPLLLATLRKNVAVEHSVVDRFLDMVCLDRFYRFQVRDGTRHS